MIRTTINGAYDIALPDDLAQRYQAFDERGWEKARMQALTSKIRELGPGCTVYYVGAEMGELAAICQMHGARMYLFEPNPLAWRSIEAIWHGNDLETPYCFPGFVSNTTALKGAQLPVKQFPNFGEISGEHGFKELHLEADNYPQIRIDDVVFDGAHLPDIITCDVEGSEFQVLLGAQNLLDRYKPVLFPSIHPEMLALFWGQWSRELRDWIIERGYRETWLANDHEMHMMYEPA